MHIKFISRGKGSAKSALIYLFQEHDNKGEIRQEIKLLRGNPEVVTAVADSLDFKHRYTSAVIAWHKEDNPTSQQIEEVLNDFEAISFAGLEGNQYCYYAVWHGEADGSGHIHIISPRVELQSGKSFNIAPPGWEKTYDLIRDKFNEKYDWASPDTDKDPHRARITNSTHMLHLDNTHAKAKKQINEAVNDLVVHGKLINAQEVEKFLDDLPGVSILPRRGDKILSVKVEGIKKNIRLRGVAYERGFDIRELGDKLREEKERSNKREPGNKARELERLQGELDKVYGQRDTYNGGRYNQENNKSPKETLRDTQRDIQGGGTVHTKAPGGDRESIGKPDKDQSKTVDHPNPDRSIGSDRSWHWSSRPWQMDLKRVPGNRRTGIQDQDTKRRTSNDTEDKREVHSQSVEQRNRGEEGADSVERHRRESLDRSIREEQRRIDDRARADITKHIKDTKRELQRGVVEHHQNIRAEFAGYEQQVQQSDFGSTEHHREAEPNLRELRRSKQEHSVQAGRSIAAAVEATSESLGRSSVVIENGTRGRGSRSQRFGSSFQGVADWFRELGRKALELPKKILFAFRKDEGSPGGGMGMKR